MKASKLALVALSISFLSVVSCSSDAASGSDTQAPQILVQSPSSGQHLERGEQFEVNILFKDNKALASYKLEIHYVADGHQHRLQPQDQWTQWSHQQISALSGTEQEVSLLLTVPDFARAGEYHLGIFAIDASGNQSADFLELDVE